jgi:hypothetical protein
MPMNHITPAIASPTDRLRLSVSAVRTGSGDAPSASTYGAPGLEFPFAYEAAPSNGSVPCDVYMCFADDE